MASAVTTPPPMMGAKDAPEKLSLIERLKKGDEIAYLVTFASALSIILVTCLLVQHLWVDSAIARHAFGWKFLGTSTWDPVNDQFGALPFIYGTVLTSMLALLMAVPVGFGAAIFLAELAPRRVSNVLTFMIELLAAVPSVVFGCTPFGMGAADEHILVDELVAVAQVHALTALRFLSNNG